jgi:type IV pilus assembly protein PilB
MATIKTFGERIADALVEDGLLSAKQVEELLEQQKKEGTRLLKLIQDKGYVSDADMVVSMGRVLNTPPINLPRISIPMETAGLVPREVAVNYKVLPVSLVGNRLYLAMADPLNVLALDDVKRLTSKEVVPMIASEKAIVDKLNNLDTNKTSLEDIVKEQEKMDAEGESDDVEVTKEQVENVSVDLAQASAEEAPVIKMANAILIQAIKDRASDIHIEPFEKAARLRYRIDGALMDAPPPPKSMLVPNAGCRKTGACASRWQARKSTCASPSCLPSMAKNACCACSINPTWPRAWKSWAWTPTLSGGLNRRSMRPTACSWSPVPRVPAKRPPCTRR